MKFRKWLIPLLVMMLLMPLIPTSGSAATSRDIPIYLDGNRLSSDTTPYIKPAGVTMVPLRVISEGLGATVMWDSATKKVTIYKDNHRIVLNKGSKTALVNDVKVSLEVSVEIMNKRTMVPLRFVSEQLGLRVDWNQEKRTITLTTPGINPPSGGQDSNELRGAWVSTVFNLDWPSTSSYGNVEAQKAEYAQLLDDLQGMGMNAVFVQVRPSADAIYPSELVPWSAYLTGTAGKNPGYDPLQYLIEETHRRGMEFHAWFNPFRATTGSDTTKLPDHHVLNQHPEWVVKFNNKYYVNPGIPEARKHIIEVIMEVVKGYDIDGVHLDDYFYPTGESSSNKFNDDSTYKTYNFNHIVNKGDWRRDNINTFVRDLGQSIHREKPQVSYGISPYGVWRNKAVDPTGSDTRASVTAYDSTYADVRKWIQNEWVDYVIPQIYWSLSRPEVRYDILADWWASEVAGTNVDLYIGHAVYKLGTSEVGWNSATEIIDQMEYNRSIPEIKGSVFFSAKDLRKNPLGLIPMLQTFYEVRE